MEVMNPILQGGMPSPEVGLYKDARSEAAFKDLEGLFLLELVKEMRKTVPEDEGIFGKSNANTLFQEMLDEVFSRAMAESGQYGIARQLAEQVMMQDEGAGVRPEGRIGGELGGLMRSRNG